MAAPTTQRKRGEIVITAAVVAPVLIQAIQWLSAGHPEAVSARHAAVWIQAGVSFAVLGWLAAGLIRSTRTA